MFNHIMVGSDDIEHCSVRPGRPVFRRVQGLAASWRVTLDRGWIRGPDTRRYLRASFRRCLRGGCRIRGR